MEPDYTANIGVHFVSAIVNGDVTGLEDHEEADLNHWLEHFPCATFTFSEDHPDFARCDISGYVGECVQVSVWKDLDAIVAARAAIEKATGE